MSSSRARSKSAGRDAHALGGATSANPSLPPSVGDDTHAGFQVGQAALADIQDVALFQPSGGSEAGQLVVLEAHHYDILERGSAMRSAHQPPSHSQQATLPNSIVSEQHSATERLASPRHPVVSFGPGSSLQSAQQPPPPSRHQVVLQPNHSPYFYLQIWHEFLIRV